MHPWRFAAGAVLASRLGFRPLGSSRRALGPLLAKPMAWRLLDVIIAVVMIAFAVSPNVGFFSG